MLPSTHRNGGDSFRRIRVELFLPGEVDSNFWRSVAFNPFFLVLEISGSPGGKSVKKNRRNHSISDNAAHNISHSLTQLLCEKGEEEKIRFDLGRILDLSESDLARWQKRRKLKFKFLPRAESRRGRTARVLAEAALNFRSRSAKAGAVFRCRKVPKSGKKWLKAFRFLLLRGK